MVCRNCGAYITPGSNHCTSCGARVDSVQTYNGQMYQQPQVYQNNYYFDENSLPPKYRPLGPWAYFGYSLLFSLPIVGFIMLIVFSLSDDNINRRNFARSFWCMLVLLVIVYVFMFALLGVGYMI